MVQEYLNEISPTIYGPNKSKTSGKPLRIPDLQTPAANHDKPATLYVIACQGVAGGGVRGGAAAPAAGEHPSLDVAPLGLGQVGQLAGAPVLEHKLCRVASKADPTTSYQKS